jgi:two-component system, response regulator YesN
MLYLYNRSIGLHCYLLAATSLNPGGIVLKLGNSFLRPKSVFFSWLLSYISILAITIIISMFAYGKSINIIQDESSRAYMASLKQLQQAVDTRLSTIHKLSVEVSLNPRINSLVNLRDSMDSYDRLEMLKVISDLKNYKVANGFINKIYIYFKQHDFIISSDARYDTEDFYKLYYKDYAIEYPDWQKLVSGNHSFQYLPVPLKYNDKNTKNTITFLQSLPMTQRNANNATLVIEMNGQAIQSSIEQLNVISQGTIFILDENDNILLTTKEITLPGSLNFNNLNKAQDIFESKFKNEKMMISYIKSDITNWKYISIIPQSVFQQRIKYAYQIFFTSVMLCLVIGGGIAYFLTKRNYNPLDKLISLFNIKTNMMEVEESVYNEYDFIEKSIINIIREKEKVYNTLDQQMDVLKNNFLSRLIKGQLDSNISFQDTCQTYNIYLDGNCFGVILFYLEDFSNLYFNTEAKAANSEEIIKTVHFILKNIVEDKLREKYKGYMAVVNDMPVCIVNFKEDAGQVNNDLEKIIAEAKEFIEKRFAIYFTASISNAHIGLEGIATGYEEAIQAIEYKMLVGNNRIILYENVKNTTHDNGLLNNYMSEQEQFMNCIRIGDYKSAKNLLREVFKMNFSDSMPSMEVAKCRMFGLINIMVNAISEISISCKNEFVKDTNILEQLVRCRTINELQIKMIDILDKAEEHFKEEKKSEGTELIRDITEFIENNYCNPDLSVSMVAEEFNMSIVTLSKFFKKHSRTGMLDYIHQIRIEKSKIFIRDGKLSVKEIAEKVGYYNSAAFIRVFKKYEGITPGKHKEGNVI